MTASMTMTSIMFVRVIFSPQDADYTLAAKPVISHSSFMQPESLVFLFLIFSRLFAALCNARALNYPQSPISSMPKDADRYRLGCKASPQHK